MFKTRGRTGELFAVLGIFLLSLPVSILTQQSCNSISDGSFEESSSIAFSPWILPLLDKVTGDVATEFGYDPATGGNATGNNSLLLS